ncbi:hypothetical protein PV326_006278 [Microctonus aethiopoides]|nr:hypothetical protein PV326_006278 [Microctonus aethiopoides]
MFGLIKLILIILILNQNSVHNSPSPLTLQLILEYSKWRSWKQIVIFDDLPLGNDGVLDYVRPLLYCFIEQGVSLSFQSTNAPKLPEALHIQTHRVGAIVLLDHVNFTAPDNILTVASNKRLFDYYISWLLITTAPNDSSIDRILRNLTIGINTDVVIATASGENSKQHEQAHHYKNRTCQFIRNYIDKYEYRDITLVNDNINENVTKNIEYSLVQNRTVSFYLVHIYKIRIVDNSSLIVDSLGVWSPGDMRLKLPMAVILRNNFRRLPIVVGIINGTIEDQYEEKSSYEEQTNEAQPLNDFINFLANSLNASLETVAHEKVGTITNKVWSNLLGDVYNNNVDIGLGYITINDERRRDMCFSHPLIRYTRNIYIRPPESGSMRDIFLQPFNNRLLLCVAFVELIIVLAIGSINYAAKNMFGNSMEKNEGLGDATLWCTGIICMQGSPWHPSTLSGKIALFASLIFALVTYNAYAGFITSILSVQATGIKTIEDLLRNNFKVGYSDIDDEFMRNTNDSNLRQLYIKAFNGRQSRLDTIVGLKKAVKGGYGFFVSATLARRALKTSLIQERCSLKEIEIEQTFTTVGLPMGKHSPYRKIINLSILKMHECGVIDRIYKTMLPDMPKCNEPTTFHSARIADVYSAFIILAIGIVTAVFLGLLERIWKQWRKYKNRFMGIIMPRLRKKGVLNCENSWMNNDNEESKNDFYYKHNRRNRNLKIHRMSWKHSPTRVDMNNHQYVFPFQH